MAVHEVTIARSGAGKTYDVVWRLIHDWIPFLHNRNFITNLPLNIDAIIAYVAEHYPDLDTKIAVGHFDASEPSKLNRIQVIDATVTDSWLSEKSGPWEYFEHLDLDAGRITIDEVHNYVHIKSSADYVMKWRRWLGEIRHCGCTFEAISQYETKIHPLIRHEVGLIRRLSSTDDKRDPLFWIRFYDHFQLLSKLKGRWTSRVWTAEYTEDNGKWTRTGGGSTAIIPRIYALYNSYSAPIAKGGKSAKLNPHPYGRMTWSELLRWYFSRNGLRIVLFLALYAVLIYLFVFGGIVAIALEVTKSIQIGPPKTQQATTAAKIYESSSPGAAAAEAAAVDLRRPVLWTPRGVFALDGAPVVLSAPAAGSRAGMDLRGPGNGSGGPAKKLSPPESHPQR